MSDPYIGEMRIWGCNFAPQYWAQCDGQLLPISQNTALFSILGTIYGGNGRVTFGLPDLKDRVPMHWGRAEGLTERLPGEVGGTPDVTLDQSQMPQHSHSMMATGMPADDDDPKDGVLAVTVGANTYAPAGSTPVVQLAPQALLPAGGGLPHNNMMPFLTLNFCICLQGLFPPRS